MDRNFRRLSLKQFAKTAGYLSDYVDKTIAKYQKPATATTIIDSDFTRKFRSLPPGPERERLVFEEAVKRGKPKNLVPVTKTVGNTEVTYYVSPNFLNIDGIFVPMTGPTAQKIADALGMNLPTSVMSRQIYDNADAKLVPSPMSAGGVIGGKQYTGEQVVKGLIGNSETSVAYSQRILDEQAKTKGQLYAGHMKDIVQPGLNSDRLYMQGWYDKDGKAIQGKSEQAESARTVHNKDHSEYAGGLRLVGNKVIKKVNGQPVEMTFEQAMKDPEVSKILSHIPGVKKY